MLFYGPFKFPIFWILLGLSRREFFNLVISFFVGFFDVFKVLGRLGRVGLTMRDCFDEMGYQDFGLAKRVR